ncbi:UDP-GalNAc:beta-1,3-N-acetylgalactosaminyltransferase 1 [Pseudolycoriella hygida]|uniref:Hexosyltransferase n=1 Tax=Pseudolycoriella hygida TaxID=35572 RepID=A0A9Q0RZD1_9DIPT|nr:UDP-GalNAc:beta-1,3-N-acetylgalactosaminyltransferase 1 [Pseudolycoriella hygida]
MPFLLQYMAKITNFQTKANLWVLVVSTGMAILMCLTGLMLKDFFETPMPATLRRAKTKFIFNNSEFCYSPSEEIDHRKNVIVIVLSARSHFKQRNLVRLTYGSVRTANNVNILRVAFMLGNADGEREEKTDEKHLRAEMKEFGDIVIGDFVDSYRNLTLKTIMAYEWLKTYCVYADIVVKTDDDVMINIFQLTKMLNEWPTTQFKSSNIWCMIHSNEKTIEDADSKYYASREEFPDGIFPNHCSGLAYVTTMVVIERTLEEIFKSFPGYVCTHEDVFMTAIIPQQINSTSKWFWPTANHITLINRRKEWFTYDLEQMKDTLLVNVLRQSAVLLKDVKRIRKRYNETIFYLVAHTDDYNILYIRLWQTLQKIFTD